MARTMKRKLRTNKKFGNRKSKRNSKKIYKKKNLTSLRKTTMKKRSNRRRGSRKMRGGVTPPFDSNESAILPLQNDEEVHDLDLGKGEEPPDFGDESNGPLNMSDLQGMTRDSGDTTGDSGLSVSNPNLSISSFSMGLP
jgi:hypothetical protein